MSILCIQHHSPPGGVEVSFQRSRGLELWKVRWEVLKEVRDTTPEKLYKK
jgi:hypothetical protein